MDTLKGLRKLIQTHRRRDIIAKKVALRFGERSESYQQIMLACDLSRDTHRGGKRKNGEPLIYHERAMFIIALEYLHIRDVDILVAIFLHDMPEDYLKDWPFVRIDVTFGGEKSRLVYAVTKPPRRRYQSDTAHDRAIFTRVNKGGPKARTIKCIDRLHNMLTLYGTEEKMVRKVFQTIQHVLPMSVQVNVLVHELMLATTEQSRRLKLNERKHY